MMRTTDISRPTLEKEMKAFTSEVLPRYHVMNYMEQAKVRSTLINMARLIDRLVKETEEGVARQ